MQLCSHKHNSQILSPRVCICIYYIIFFRLILVTAIRRIGLPIIGFSEWELVSFPPFLRFEHVDVDCVGKTPSLPMDFESPPLSVEAKFKLLEMHLQRLKQAIKGAELFFNVVIDQNDPDCINNPSQLLNHLRHQLLPVCNRPSHFTFNINLCIETSAATNLIASILQIHEVNRCYRVTIKFFQSGQGIRLPVSAISDWLNRAGSGMEIGVVGGKHPERILKISAFGGFQNGQEMVDHLKKVGASQYFEFFMFYDFTFQKLDQ